MPIRVAAAAVLPQHRLLCGLTRMHSPDGARFAGRNVTGCASGEGLWHHLDKIQPDEMGMWDKGQF